MPKEMIPIVIHVAAVVIITALFLFNYIRQRYLYQILFAIWAPTTLLRYLSSNRVYLIVLGVVQLLMFFLVIFALFRSRKDFDKPEEEPLPDGAQTEDEGHPDPTEAKLAEEEPEKPAEPEDQPQNENIRWDETN